VWIGARGQQAADAVGARFVQLDVTDDASVAAAIETVAVPQPPQVADRWDQD
jgi:hypothetical protein